jgi:MbtH protein
MTGSPFESADAPCLVLVNAEGQYSLWPSALAVPDGWEVRLRDAPRQECAAYIDAHWTDLRPRSTR